MTLSETADWFIISLQLRIICTYEYVSEVYLHSTAIMKVVLADFKEGQRSVDQYLLCENPERQVLLLRHGSQSLNQAHF